METHAESAFRAGGQLASIAERGRIFSHLDHDFAGRDRVEDKQQGRSKARGGVRRGRTRSRSVGRRRRLCPSVMRRLLDPLFLAAALAAAGCRHATSAPTRWADVRPAANVGFVVGEVRSSSHRQPLESTRVWLLAPNGDPRDSVVTDRAGAFVLGPVPPGAYRLRARALLHRPLDQSLALRAGGVDTVRMRLTFDDVGLISDCVGPTRAADSQGFGSQFCRR